eukprot:SAG31_NODE_11136_length_1062_cov_1.180685_1_plen_130_part_00
MYYYANCLPYSGPGALGSAVTVAIAPHYMLGLTGPMFPTDGVMSAEQIASDPRASALAEGFQTVICNQLDMRPSECATLQIIGFGGGESVTSGIQFSVTDEYHALIMGDDADGALAHRVCFHTNSMPMV